MGPIFISHSEKDLVLVNEMARVHKEEVEPLLSSKPGFQGFGHLIKPDGGGLFHPQLMLALLLYVVLD
jgi:hypothetical protein